MLSKHDYDYEWYNIDEVLPAVHREVARDGSCAWYVSDLVLVYDDFTECSHIARLLIEGDKMLWLAEDDNGLLSDPVCWQFVPRPKMKQEDEA